MMTKQYDKAAKVYVWLGTPAEKTELAMANIKGIECLMVEYLRIVHARERDIKCQQGTPA